MEVLRRCPLTIAQQLVYYATAVSTAVLGQSHKTMSVAPLLSNKEANKVQLSQASSTSLLVISSGPTTGSSTTSLLLISPGPSEWHTGSVCRELHHVAYSDRDWETCVSPTSQVPGSSKHIFITRYNAAEVEVLLYIHRNRRLIRNGSPRTATSTFPQFLSSDYHPVERLKCCFTSTETVGLLGTGASNSKHWFTTYFFQGGRCRKAMLGVCGSLGRPSRLSHSSWALTDTTQDTSILGRNAKTWWW